MHRLIRIWAQLPSTLRLPILKVVQRNNHLYRRLLFRYVNAKDRANVNWTGLPPAELRYRVSSYADAETFLQVGQTCANDIKLALQRVGRELSSFKTILDFGCGCGRTLIHLAKEAPAATIHGADVDKNAIAWCRQNLSYGSFTVPNPTPPTSYAANKFDLIYAISVFTHLDEDYQFQWLDELKRIAQPEAIVLLTVDSLQVGDKDFVFEHTYEKGLFPAWYQNTFHSKAYILEKYSAYFRVLDYITKGMNNHQDVVVLQKVS